MTKIRTKDWLIISVDLLVSIAVESRLTPGYNGRACTDQTESFTCELTGDGANSGVIWVLATISSGNDLQTITPSTDLSEISSTDAISWSFTVFYDSSNDNFTCVMTAPIRSNLDGAVLDCRRNDNSNLLGSVTIQLATQPTPPLSTTQLVVSSSDGGIDVTLGWESPTDNGGRDNLSYTVTIPQLSYSETVVTSTSVTVTDANYNVDYTVSVVATNCAGNSSAATLPFRINGCPPLTNPVNGAFGPIANRLQDTVVTFQCDSGYQSSVTMVTCEGTDTLMWSPDPETVECTSLTPTTGPPMNCTEQLSPPQNGSVENHSVPALPSTQVTFQCDSGLFPDMIMTATCQPTGQWDRDPRNITCRTMPVSCDLPDPPPNGLILDPNTNTTEGSVISLQCELGYMLVGGGAATCSNSGSWEPDLAMLCVVIAAASPIGPIVGGVVGSLLFLIVLIVIIIIVLLVVSSKRAKYTVPAGPVYDEVSPAPNQQIELNTNSAYGPVTPGPVYEDVLPAPKEEIKLKSNDAYGQVGR